MRSFFGLLAALAIIQTPNITASAAARPSYTNIPGPLLARYGLIGAADGATAMTPQNMTTTTTCLETPTTTSTTTSPTSENCTTTPSLPPTSSTSCTSEALRSNVTPLSVDTATQSNLQSMAACADDNASEPCSSLSTPSPNVPEAYPEYDTTVKLCGGCPHANATSTSTPSSTISTTCNQTSTHCFVTHASPPGETMAGYMSSGPRGTAPFFGLAVFAYSVWFMTMW